MSPPHHSEVSIDRIGKSYMDVTADPDLADCTPVYFNTAGGLYGLPAGSGVGACDVYASVDNDADPYEPVYDKDGQAVTITFETGKKKEFPDVFFAVGLDQVQVDRQWQSAIVRGRLTPGWRLRFPVEITARSERMSLAQKRLSGESGWSLGKTQSFKAALGATSNLGTTGARMLDNVDRLFSITTTTPWGTNNFSVCGWFKLNTMPVVSNIWYSLTGGNYYPALYVFAAGQIRLFYGIGSGLPYSDSATGTATTNKWHFFVANIERGVAAKIYFNDMITPIIDVDLTSQPTADWSGTPYHRVGKVGTYPLDGAISRYGLLSPGELLTEADRVSLYNAGNGKFFAELDPALAAKFAHYWNLNEAGGNSPDHVSTFNLVASGTSLPTATTGPREATASDLVGGYHGVLTNMDTVNSWSADTPDGSYSPLKAETSGQVELLENISFEDGGGDVFNYWLKSHAGSSEIHEETTDIHSGSRCVRLDIDGSSSYAAVAQANVMTISAEYTLSFWAKCTTPGYSMATEGVAGVFVLTDEWVRYSITGAAVSTGVVLKRNGAPDQSIYIDDVSLQFSSPYNATMTGFSDVDAAHVDGPEGNWGPHIPDNGSAGLDGWLSGGVKDSRSANVPSGKYVGVSRSCIDLIGHKDLRSLADSSLRSPDIPSQLSGCKSMSFSAYDKCITSALTAADKTVTGQGAFTFSVWMKGTDTTSSYLMGNASASSAEGFFLLSDTWLRGYIRSGSANVGYIIWDAQSAGFFDDNWHLVTMDWDGTTDTGKFRLSVDGVVVVTGTVTVTSIGTPSTEFFIGGTIYASHYWHNHICLPTVTAGRAWTEAEMAAHYASGALPGDVTSSWRFIEPDACELTLDHSFKSDKTRVITVSKDAAINDIPQFTWEGWIRWDGTTAAGYAGIASKAGWTKSLWVTNSARLDCYINSSATVDARAMSVDASITANQWHHVAWIGDATPGGTSELYIDGVEVKYIIHTDNDGGAGGITDANYDFELATDVNLAKSWGGEIGRFSIHNGKLTETQIAQLAAGRNIGAPVIKHQFDNVLSLPYLSGAKAINCAASGNKMVTEAYPAVHADDDLTWMGWIKGTKQGATYQTITQHGQVALCVGVSTGFIYAIGNAGSFGLAGTTDVLDGHWHHCCITYTASTDVWKIYADGNLDLTSAPNANTQGIVSSPRYHGAFNATSYYAFAALADIRTYNAVLTQAQVRSVIAGIDVTDDLIAEWKFADSSRSIASCANGYSLEHDGSSVVKGAWSEDLNNPHTTCAWIKPSGSGTRCIFAVSSYEFYVASDNTLRIFTSSANLTSGSELVVPGEWTHVAFRWDGVDRTLWLNGVEVGSDTTASTATGTDFFIGGYNQTTDEFIGQLDDVRVYDSAIDDADLATLAAGGEPAIAPVAHWTFDDGPQGGEPSDGDPICVWESQLGERISFTQEDADARPLYVASGDNGQPGLEFDGAASVLQFVGQLLTGTEGAVQIACHPDNNALQMAWFSQSAELSYHGLREP